MRYDLRNPLKRKNLELAYAKAMGIYIPSADERHLVEAMERETW